MMGGPGGRMAFERETSKPKNTSETLRRFVRYLKPYWPVLLLAAAYTDAELGDMYQYLHDLKPIQK